MQATDTIVALSTPPGRSGIGVIRLSGASSLDLLKILVRDQHFAPEPNRVTLKGIYVPDRGELLDRALITYFKSPHSFTGEDVVELSCHGSPPLLLHVIDALLSSGARTADPGEFTLRALSNGRMNLCQAEAVRDLIDAQTLAAVQQAARQLNGELSSRLQPFKDTLLEIIVPLESALEFVEDDLPEDITSHLVQSLETLITRLRAVVDTFQSGRLLKEGLKITLTGCPNVGKSSLFNSLLMQERAIVTSIPGTTRDSLSELININGIPVLLTDTAGLRSSADVIEQLGIERTEQAVVDADFVVVVIDGSQPLTDEDKDVLAKATKRNYLVALNKSDLKSFNVSNLQDTNNHAPVISVSAKTRDGLDELINAIMEPFTAHGIPETDFLITNARHYDLLKRTISSLQSSQELLKRGSSEEITLTGLHNALRFLGEITGETTPEDILTQIFSTFCIGK
ncbi:MAG TPA: tRNA uridine-5-carboxymethylaminomethyl(34) synthesis GTPase MnmE [Pyrinomonadaceae bacterium]